MISLNRYFKHDIFRNKERLLDSMKAQAAAQPISFSLCEAKVASTTEFDNNYSNLLNSCYQDCRDVIDAYYHKGFNACIFELGPFLTSVKLQKITNYAPFGNLRKQELIDSNHLQKCYELPDGIKYAGIFSVNQDSFHKACVHIQNTSNAVIILSKENRLFSEDYLDKLFYSSAFEKDKVSFATLNWATLCLEICPLGDFVVNIGGAFDDLYRAILFYFCQNTLSNDLRDLLLIGTEIKTP